jgi:hypothetical protein
MRNVSDKSCAENQITHCSFSNVYRKSCGLLNNVEEYCRARQATDGNVTGGHRMPKAANTHSGYVIIFAFPL